MKKTCSIAPRAILMCAGEYEKMEILRRAEDLVIAVDGGLPRLLAQGIEPDLILGDFDSLGEDLKKKKKSACPGKRMTPTRSTPPGCVWNRDTGTS